MGLFAGQPVTVSSVNSEAGIEAAFTTAYPIASAILLSTARGVNTIAKWCIDHGLANS